MDIESTLKDRGANYGAFRDQAEIAQILKRAMRACPSWGKMKSGQREACELIAMKLSRILNGNPDHLDSWVDLIGYATLVVRDIEADANKS